MTKAPHRIIGTLAMILSGFASWLLPQWLAALFSPCKKKSHYHPGRRAHSSPHRVTGDEFLALVQTLQQSLEAVKVVLERPGIADGEFCSATLEVGADRIVKGEEVSRLDFERAGEQGHGRIDWRNKQLAQM